MKKRPHCVETASGRAAIAEACRNQSGAVTVIAGIFMVILIGFSGFALDFGVRYTGASRLQNSLDSAALAAVRELPAAGTGSSAWAAAEAEAIKYALLNNCDLSAEDIEPIYKDDIATNKIIGIKVTKSIVVEYRFAKVLGFDSATLTRTSCAGLSPAGGVTGAIPLCIPSVSLQTAIAADAVTGLLIKCSTKTSDFGIDCSKISGWFGALRFDGSGASTYSYLLANGYDGELYVGQILDIENGNMSGPTLSGFTERYNRCSNGCTAENHLPDCPKLVFLPVIEVISSSQVKIVSFATFFLEECGGSGNNSYIKATYIQDIVLPNSASGAEGEDFGVYVSRLWS